MIPYVFRRIGLFLFMCTCVLVSHAQDVSRFWVETGVAAHAYRGDLQSNFGQWNAGLKIGFTGLKRQRINTKLQLGAAKITAQNMNLLSTDPNIAPARFVQSNLLFGTFELYINLIKNKAVTVFIAQGLGFSRFIPQDDQGNSLVTQFGTRKRNETYSTNSIVLPSSVGALYRFKKSDMALGLTIGLMNPQTDYLDNYSQLGNPNNNDNWMFVKTSVYIPVSLKLKK